jgi:hypothetical protein
MARPEMVGTAIYSQRLKEEQTGMPHTSFFVRSSLVKHQGSFS